LKLLKSKWIWLLTISIVLIIVMGLTSDYGNKSNIISSIISVPLTPIQKLISMTDNKISETREMFRDMSAVKQENEALKVELERLKKENRELQEYKVKNEELVRLLDIKNQFSEYEPIGANIIAKDPGNWFNTFKIDRGINEGIHKNSPVINADGLVGRVAASQPFSSQVISLIDTNTTVSAKIIRTRDPVRIRGDLSLINEGLCIMDYISPDSNIQVGDTVETSGLGGIYPKGIMIGTVIEIREISSEANRYALVRPSVDFRRLEDVLVLKTAIELEK